MRRCTATAVRPSTSDSAVVAQNAWFCGVFAVGHQCLQPSQICRAERGACVLTTQTLTKDKDCLFGAPHPIAKSYSPQQACPKERAAAATFHHSLVLLLRWACSSFLTSSGVSCGRSIFTVSLLSLPVKRKAPDSPCHPRACRCRSQCRSVSSHCRMSGIVCSIFCVATSLPSTFSTPVPPLADAAQAVEGQRADAQPIIRKVELDCVLAGRQQLRALPSARLRSTRFQRNTGLPLSR